MAVDPSAAFAGISDEDWTSILAAGGGQARGEAPDMAPHPADDPPKAADAESTNQTTILTELAGKHYRLVRSEDGEAYAVKKAGPNVAILLGRDGTFGNQLVRLFLEQEGKATSDQAERMAIKIMRAYLDDNAPEPVHLRVGRHEDSVVLDLGTADGKCVIITADGWAVHDRSPVIFRRGAALPIPEPQRSDDGLERLRKLVNANDAQFRLGVAWLVACLIPDIPHPILTPRGEQGSAKTTLARVFQAVIDPSGVKPGALSRDEQDFAVRMNAAYVQAFDNASAIPPWLSDALCRAATGDSFVARTLYANREITIMQYVRPVILTTIDAGQLNGDLVERSLPLDLDRIAPEKRRTERAAIGDDPAEKPGLYDQLDKDRPYILAAILDLLVDVFAHIPKVQLDRLPRMADFGKILAALDAAKGWETFSLFYDLVQHETGALIEGNPFASRLIEFMSDRQEWTGTATALRDELTAMLPDKDHPPKGWPADATRASGQLKRIAPSLRVHHLEIDQDREGKSGTRTWKVCKTASAASAASATEVDQWNPADAKADASGVADADADNRLTLLTLADASDSVSVSHVSPGQAPDFSSADAADADSLRKNAGTLPAVTERDQSSMPAADGTSLRAITCPTCGEQAQSAVQPGERAWCSRCETEYTAV